MKIKSILAASAFAVAAATSANAADVIIAQEVVVPAPVFSWTGFYAGAQLGGAWSDASVAGLSGDKGGFLGGLYAGYNYDLGNNVVLGVETDWAWADLSKGASNTTTEATVTANVNQQWAGATRVRVGYAVDRWLPYVAGGVAYGKITSDANSLPISAAEGTAATVLGTSSDVLTGWTVGAGVDYAMTDNVILRLEYRYADFGDKDYGTSTAPYTVDYKTNDVRVGVAYKF